MARGHSSLRTRHIAFITYKREEPLRTHTRCAYKARLRRFKCHFQTLYFLCEMVVGLGRSDNFPSLTDFTTVLACEFRRKGELFVYGTFVPTQTYPLSSYWSPSLHAIECLHFKGLLFPDLPLIAGSWKCTIIDFQFVPSEGYMIRNCSRHILCSICALREHGFFCTKRLSNVKRIPCVLS